MSEKKSFRNLSAEFILLTVVLIWAINMPLVKWTVEKFDVFVYNSLRFICGTIVAAIVYFSRYEWKRIQKEDWGKLLTVGFVAYVCYQLVFIVGIRKTTAGNASLFLATAPLWTVFFNRILHKEQISNSVWLGMVISLAGIITIILGSGKEISLGGDVFLGDVLMLIAAMLWALNTNLQKPLLVKYSASQLTVIMLLVGTPFLTAVAIPPAMEMDFASLHWTYYFAMFLSGTISIGIANYFWSIGVKRIGPAKTGNYNNLVPVLALFFSYIALGEKLEMIQLFGASATICGVWIARREKKITNGILE
ncbi:MAG: DMT family transporter [Ignavibacteriales bacterium]|nr:DMT family transporter [Ignavibacteriales bacterium]